MDPTTCPRYKACNAQLCPLDEDIGKRNWYADEDICGLKKNWTLLWVKNQKKIKKKARDVWKYYLYVMLDRDFIITKNITGLDPDKDEKPQLKAWLKAHPEITDAFREAQKRKSQKAVFQRARV